MRPKEPSEKRRKRTMKYYLKQTILCGWKFSNLIFNIINYINSYNEVIKNEYLSSIYMLTTGALDAFSLPLPPLDQSIRNEQQQKFGDSTEQNSKQPKDTISGVFFTLLVIFQRVIFFIFLMGSNLFFSVSSLCFSISTISTFFSSLLLLSSSISSCCLTIYKQQSEKSKRATEESCQDNAPRDETSMNPIIWWNCEFRRSVEEEKITQILDQKRRKKRNKMRAIKLPPNEASLMNYLFWMNDKTQREKWKSKKIRNKTRCFSHSRIVNDLEKAGNNTAMMM